MKKKETVLLIENWRKFIKENSDEDENIFRSFDNNSNNVLDRPSDSESGDENFYASNLDSESLGEEESDDREYYLRRFCELVGINCDDKEELANYFADQAEKSGLDSSGKEYSKYSKYDTH